MLYIILNLLSIIIAMASGTTYLIIKWMNGNILLWYFPSLVNAYRIVALSIFQPTNNTVSSAAEVSK